MKLAMSSISLVVLCQLFMLGNGSKTKDIQNFDESLSTCK